MLKIQLQNKESFPFKFTPHNRLPLVVYTTNFLNPNTDKLQQHKDNSGR